MLFSVTATAILEISIYPGGKHYYGLLFVGKERIDITRTIDEQIAKKLAEWDGDWIYRIGEVTKRFDSEDELVETTIAYLKQKYPNVKLLFEGSKGILDPQRVVFGPAKYKNKFNKLYDEAEAIGWYGKNLKKMERISSKFKELLKQFETEFNQEVQS